MAARKGKSVPKAKVPYSRSAVAETFDRLAVGRRSRRRQPGDGGGVDIGIANCFGITIEKHLQSVKNPETRKRLHDHIQHHVDEAMKPLLKLMQRDGAKEEDLRFFADIGPNMFRTIIEYFEEEN